MRCPSSPIDSGSGSAGGWASSYGLGGVISPALNTSSIKGINRCKVLSFLNASLHAIRTSRSGCFGLLLATLKAAGTTVSNLIISAISYTNDSGLPECKKPIAGA